MLVLFWCSLPVQCISPHMYVAFPEAIFAQNLNFAQLLFPQESIFSTASAMSSFGHSLLCLPFRKGKHFFLLFCCSNYLNFIICARRVHRLESKTVLCTAFWIVSVGRIKCFEIFLFVPVKFLHLKIPWKLSTWQQKCSITRCETVEKDPLWQCPLWQISSCVIGNWLGRNLSVACQNIVP